MVNANHFLFTFLWSASFSLFFSTTLFQRVRVRHKRRWRAGKERIPSRSFPEMRFFLEPAVPFLQSGLRVITFDQTQLFLISGDPFEGSFRERWKQFFPVSPQ